ILSGLGITSLDSLGWKRQQAIQQALDRHCGQELIAAAEKCIEQLGGLLGEIKSENYECKAGAQKQLDEAVAHHVGGGG
ncbi:unnamed protein product, partial [marine sediment metagenome]